MWSFFFWLFCSRLFVSIIVFVFVFVFCRSFRRETEKRKEKGTTPSLFFLPPSGKEKNFSVNKLLQKKRKKRRRRKTKKRRKGKKRKRFFCVLLDVWCGVASSSLLLLVGGGGEVGVGVSFEDIYTKKKKKTSCTSLHEGKSRDLARRRRKTWR